MKLFYKIIVACVLISSYVNASDKVGASFTGGIAKAIGDGSNEMKLGLNLEGTIYNKLNKIVYLGGKFGFNRWSIKDLGIIEADIEAHIAYLEFAGILRVNIPIVENVNFFFEPSPGLYVGIAKATVTYYGESRSDSDSETDFGLSLATGFDIYNFEIKPEFKIVFTEGESTKWFTITAGFNF